MAHPSTGDLASELRLHLVLVVFILREKLFQDLVPKFLCGVVVINYSRDLLTGGYGDLLYRSIAPLGEELEQRICGLAPF